MAFRDTTRPVAEFKSKGGTPTLSERFKSLIALPEQKIPDPFDVEANAAQQMMGPSDLIPEWVERKTGSAALGIAAGFLSPSPVKIGKGMADKLGIIKQKGGNWVPDRTQPMYDDAEELARMDAVGRPSFTYDEERAIGVFENKQIENFIRNKVGTEADSVRLTLDKGENPFLSTTAIDSFRGMGDADALLQRDLDKLKGDLLWKPSLVERRAASGVSLTPLAKTDKALDYELLVDAELQQMPLKDFWSRGEYPEFRNLKDDAVVNYFKYGYPFVQPIREIVEHGVKAGDIKIEDLLSGKTTVENVLKYGVKTNQKLAKMGEQFVKYSLDDAAEVPFKTGKFHIKELKHPGEFTRESNQMSNSIRGYEPRQGMKGYVEGITKGGESTYGAARKGWEAIEDGSVRTFSLRTNTKGKESLVSIEAKFNPTTEQYELVQVLGHKNANPTKEQWKIVDEFAEKMGIKPMKKAPSWGERIGADPNFQVEDVGVFDAGLGP